MEPKLMLNLSIEEVNKILTGLDYFQRDVKTLSDKIVTISEGQIAQYNQQVKDANTKAEPEDNSNKKQESKKENNK